MKKIVKHSFCFLITAFLFINVSALQLDIQSSNAILINANDSKVLYQKNEKDKVQIASLTKIMTAIVVLEKANNLDDKITLTSEDFKGLKEENLVTAGFTINQIVTYRDLLYGLLLPSGADAAMTLSRSISGNTDNFVKLMNAKAKELNLKSTHFTNPIGLDDEKNYSTVKDVLTMFEYALDNKDFKKIITTKSYTTSDGKLTLKSSVKSNKNVGIYLQGGKTGTTDKAGLCLASLASTNNANLVLVTTGAPYDKKGPHNFEDAKTIYGYFIKNYDYQTLLTPKDVMLSLDTLYAKKDKVDFYPSKNIKGYLPNNFDKRNLEYKYEGIKTIKTTMEKGTKLGTLEILYGGEKIDSVPVILKEKQEFSILKYLNKNIIIVYVAGAVIILFILLILTKHKRKKRRRKKK